MAKTIFRGFEVNKNNNDVVFLQLNKTFQEEPEEIIEEEVPVKILVQDFLCRQIFRHIYSDLLIHPIWGFLNLLGQLFLYD